MNLRYISLLLLLVFVAGIGAISAEDISDMGEISSDEVADEVISVDDGVTDVSTSDADEVTSDVEPTQSSTYTWGDFKSEVEDTSVNTVKLNQSNIAPSSDSSDQISINHDITIVGGYGYYIGNADWNSAESYKNSDILSFTNDEFLTDSFNHVYVSVDGTGDGSSVDNPTSLTNAITANIADNTIIHIADGNYEVTSQVTIQAKENITIVADNPGKVNIAYKSTNKVYLTLKGINNFSVIGINFNYTYTLITFGTATLNGKSNFCPTNIVIDKCNFDGNGVKVSAINSGLTGTRNLTISNSNFTSSNARFLSITTSLSDYKQGFSNYVLGECVVNITNSNFYNCSTDALYLSDPKDNQNSPNSVIKHYIDNCKFYNTGLTVAVGTQLKTDSLFEIKNCVFNNEKGPSIVNTFSSGIPGGIFTFENNNISSDYAIQLGANAKVISPLTFRILNNASVKVSVNESVDLIGELVDDKGNRIYHAGLKLDVNGSEMSPVINQNGLYVLSFTPEVMGELQIDVNCNPIDELDVDIFTLIVSGNPNLTVNCNDSVYGDPFNVNVTLDNGVSGENVTFSIIDSTGNVIKSTNSKIDNAFASASFEYVPAGDYNVKVTYDGDDNFGTSSVSKAFSISKANSTLNLNVDLNIAASDNFTVEAIVPGVAGIVTFRINNTEYTKTESVSDGVAVAVFDALSVGEYTVIASWAGDDNYNPSEEYNITFNVVKTDVDLNISADDVDWGNDVNVIVKTNSKFTGNITVKLGDKEEIVEIKDGSGQVSFADLKADTYNVTAKFNETELFLSSQKDINVTVNKVNSTLTLGDDITFDWDKSGSTTVSYTGATGVTASIDEVEIKDGVITVSGLAAGDYTLSVSTVADENHTSITKTVNVRVNKVNSTLTLGDEITFDWNKSGSTTVSYTGATNISASVDGGVVSVDGNTITVSGLSAGNHTLSVSTVADENHTSITKTVSVKVNKVNATIDLNDIAFDYGSFNSTTFDGEGIKNVTATILNHPDADVAVSANTITVSGLDAGNYTLEVSVVPDENHNAVTGTVNVTVNKVDSVAEIMNEVVFDYGGIGQCSVFTDGANNFTAVVDGHSEAKITIENGIVNVSGLNAGKYTLKVTTNPDRNHKSVTRTVNVTVNKVDSKLTVPDITFTYGESATVSAVISNASGIANASVVGHPEAKVTVNGTNITVSGLNAGTYTLTATTVGDVNYNPVSANATVTVKGVDVPAAQALSTNVPDNSQSPTFSIKLDKDATGNFTVSVDGKVVDTKPLKDGSASITAANLPVGNHNITISYSGDGKYAPITQNTTLTIKEPVKPTPKVTKKATKIVAKKKTFKAKVKVKKYTITLKSGKTLLKKVKVTLKVKGKTYKATTNKKGKATFKIKNLKKKGTYKAVIKFKGNKNYKASSKKVKIKVKK